jgi:serine/threonine protein phosphatase PrpC
MADQRIVLLTKYHTMVDQRDIIRDFSEMKSLNGSNYLYNSLGLTLPTPIEYDPIACAAPFRALLCTDGFMELTVQRELGALNARCTTVDEFPRVVADMAKNKRLPDNYSAILIEATGEDDGG